MEIDFGECFGDNFVLSFSGVNKVLGSAQKMLRNRVIIHSKRQELTDIT